MQVYLITNLNNGKYYVGKTSKPRLVRYLQNLVNMAIKGHDNRPLLHRAVRKHGIQSFVIERLALCDTNEQASSLERLWIIALGSRDTKVGYNISEGGEGSPGVRFSPEVRKRWSEQRKGRVPWNKGLRYECPKLKEYCGSKNLFFGRKHSEATRRAVAESNKRRVWTPEARARMSQSVKASNATRIENIRKGLKKWRDCRAQAG